MRKSIPYIRIVAAPEAIKPFREDELTKRKAIEQALERDLKVAPCKINVRVKHTDVVLSGKLPSSSAKMAAEFDAWAVRGIGHVTNRLKVARPDQEPLVTPEKMRTQALKLIRQQPDLNGSHVEISASPGKLTLTGFVMNSAQEQKIHGLALHIPGVLEVINKVSIVPSQKPTDQRIAQELKTRIYKDIYIDVNTIDVEVNNGRVFLSGYVERPEDVERARQLAQIEGVASVHMDILIAGT